MYQVNRVPMTLPAVLVVIASLVGCAKHTPTEPGGSSNVNPDPPNGNARIQVQSTFGDPAKWSAIYDMTAPSALGSAFHGWHDDQPVVGRLGVSGSLQWSTRLPYILTGVLSLSHTAPVP